MTRNKTLILIATVAVVILALLAVQVLRRQERNRWTTSSEVARVQFEECLSSIMKIYYGDAVAHCAKAVKADPNFAVAKVFYALLINRRDPTESKELQSQVRAADKSRLTPRERFLIDYHLARLAGKQERASQILSSYLSSHPDDPFALTERCNELWLGQKMQASEKCYQRVRRIDPNWVEAQNRLGYAAMAQGRFKEAEELFDTYRYIAPDQANPHDSLGELLTLVGRYGEAQKELAAAISTRADFCASYEHWVQLDLLQSRFDDAEKRIAAMKSQADCAKSADLLTCGVSLWRAAHAGDWSAAWDVAHQAGCIDHKNGDVFVIAFRAALELGKRSDAARIKDRIRALETDTKMPPEARNTWAAVLDHLDGLEALKDGDNTKAAKSFREADAKLRYWSNAGLGTFKLFNRLSLAEALSREGKPEEAAQVRREIASVNPKIVQFDYLIPEATPNAR